MTLFYRVLYHFYRLVSGRWHWVQRHFTRPGLAVLGTLILTALLAPDTDNNLTYQALPLLLFLLVIAVCLSWLFRAPFSATRLLPRFGTAGCPLHYRVVVRNLSRRGEGQKLDAGPLSDEPDRFFVLEAGQVETGLAKLK